MSSKASQPKHVSHRSAYGSTDPSIPAPLSPCPPVHYPSPMTTIRTVTATRYVAPLREGGSLPGLMEADDLGTYVVKYRGAPRASAP